MNNKDKKILQFPQTKKMREKIKQLDIVRNRLDKLNRLVLELKKLPEAAFIEKGDNSE